MEPQNYCSGCACTNWNNGNPTCGSKITKHYVSSECESISACKGHCNADEAGTPLNVCRNKINLSDLLTIRNKDKVCLDFFETNKNIAYFPFIDGKVNGTPLLQKVVDDNKNRYQNCLELREKIKNGKLTLKEYKNLYNNISSQFLSKNTLNLYLYLVYWLEKLGYPSLPSEYIDNIIVKILSQFIWSLFVNTNYGDALQYNYSDAFNFLFVYTSRWLYYLESYIFTLCTNNLVATLE